MQTLKALGGSLALATFASPFIQHPQEGDEAPGTQATFDAAMPTPTPADVASPDALIAAVYDVISGPAGEARDWQRFRSLFTADARLAAVQSTAESAAAPLLSMSPDGYIERSEAWLVDNGFFETEVARHTDSFGNILQAFSTYEGRQRMDDEEPFMSGINSFQLVHSEGGWRVHSILWEATHASLELPEAFRSAR